MRVRVNRANQRARIALADEAISACTKLKCVLLVTIVLGQRGNEIVEFQGHRFRKQRDITTGESKVLMIMAISELAQGVLEMPADIQEFGMNLSMAGVLQPLLKQARHGINFELMAKQQEIYTLTKHFLENCMDVEGLTYICSNKSISILSSQNFIELTKSEEANRPSVVWKYWLEPAELSMDVDIHFDTLMITLRNVVVKQNAILSGVLKILIRTEFALCMVNVEYYPHNIEVRNSTPQHGLIPTDDLNEMKSSIRSFWIPKFIKEVTRVVATRDFCEKWLPQNYYYVIKY